MTNFSFNFDFYSNQKDKWPKTGNYILAQYDDDSIIVYQAYKNEIVDEILKHKNFHSQSCLENGYNMNRMSWIKTNFLWMMFRSGWATKKNQERILAIRITRDGFEYILSKAVNSSSNNKDIDNNLASRSDEVRLQWDPDHLPNGDKVPTGRRAIQIGIRGKMLDKFSKEFIIDVLDITDFVIENRQFISNDSSLKIPKEEIYPIFDDVLCKKINLNC